MRNKVTNILVLLLMTFTFIFNGAYAVSAAYAPEMKLKQSNAEAGNVFFDGEGLDYSVEITSVSNTAYEAQLAYEVTDSAGNIVYSKNENFTIGARSTTVKRVKPYVEKYGSYDIKATLTGEFGTVTSSRKFAVAAKSEAKSGTTGVQLHFQHDVLNENVDITKHLLSGSGYSWVRDDLNWSDTETQKAAAGAEKIYQMPQERVDNINSLIAGGSNVCLTLQFKNPLYDNGEFPSTEEGIDAYAKFCGYTASYFKGKVNAFEIGNEPDWQSFTVRDVSGAEYARVLKRARDAIKAVDANIKVIGGSMCSHRDPHNFTFLQEFANEINSNGGWRNYMDAVSYHPYAEDGYYSDEVVSLTFLEELDCVHEQLGSDIPAWVTEYGASSYKNDAGAWVCSQEQQAADLVRTTVTSKSDSSIEMFSIYNLREKGTDKARREDNLGIVDLDYNAKPAFFALSSINRALGDAEFVQSYANRDYYTADQVAAGQANRKFDAYRFKNNESDIFVLWARKGKKAVLNIDNNASRATANTGRIAEIRDAYGNLIDANYTAGITGYSEDGSNATISADTGRTIEVRDLYGNTIEGSQITITEKPIVVVSKPKLDIYDDGSYITVTGSAEKPFSDITLLATKYGDTNKSIAALQQTRSDGNNYFRFRFRADENSRYIIYLSEAGTAYVPELELKRGSTESGNIFFDDKGPGYSVTIKSMQSEPYNAALGYVVTDEDGNVVDSGEESIMIEATSTTVKQIVPKVNKYGIYNINVKLSSGFGEVTASDKFGVAARNENNSDFSGVQLHFHHTMLEENEQMTNALLSDGGFSWVRDDMGWDYTETQKAVYTIPQWREDNINSLVNAGSKVCLALDYTNPIYDNGEFPSTEEGIDAYAKFCGYVAEYFKGRVDALEIGNEPDLQLFTVRDVSGAEYARVLKRARDAIKAVDENIKVIGGAMCSHRDSHNLTFLQEFADEINSNGGWRNYMDAVSYHPYAEDGCYSDEVASLTFLEEYDCVKQRLGSDVPVWISGYGTPSYQNSSGAWVYTPKQQAADLVRTSVAARSESAIENFTFYNLREKGNSITVRDENFGLVNNDYSAKPAYIAVSNINRTLNNTEFVQSYANRDYYTDEQVAAGQANRRFDTYRFKNGTADIFVMWSRKDMTAELSIDNNGASGTSYSETDSSAVISASSDRMVEVRDMYGNSIEGNRIAITDMPVIIVSKPMLDITQDGENVTVSGSAQKAFSDIVLAAQRRGEFMKEFIDIRQTRSDGNGYFSFNLNIAPQTAYTLHISENENRQSVNVGNCDYDIDLSMSVNGENVDSLNGLKSGDIVNAALNVYNNTQSTDGLMFIVATYKTDGTLSGTKIVNSEWNGSSAQASVEFEVGDISDASMIRFMLWKKNIEPVCISMTVNNSK